MNNLENKNKKCEENFNTKGSDYLEQEYRTTSDTADFISLFAFFIVA